MVIRHFNTADPSVAADHYCLDPLTRINASTCGADEAHLLVFDRSTKKPWSKEIWKKSEMVDGRAVLVWGM